MSKTSLLSSSYNPKEHEDVIYKKWEMSGYFSPDKPAGKRGKAFTMSMAPPNITGSLHMGHALEYTLSDILIRYKRMKGFNTLWLPGTDHAGIATQNVVEKELKKEGETRDDLGREKFLERVWEWKEKYGNIIIDQLKKLGVSADWSRLRFTMDSRYQKAVEVAFLHYYKKGWIYQGERVINWCTRCQTSLSDLELEYKEERGKFYYIHYGPLTLGTARPETKLGDTALAVNPKDKRYKEYVGKEIEIQSVDPSIPLDQSPRFKTIKIKVVADRAADPEFGTGVIKVTPAHDMADFEIYERHLEIPIIKIIDENGRMNKAAGIRYEGLKVSEARTQITEDLQKLGLLEKIEDYIHNVATCYRCGSIIEPLLSKQWFLKMDELAKTAIKAVKSGKVRFHPKRWEKLYFHWLKNIKDWCISRQIWWGHKIPLEGEKDVLDTWFSSALWPFATLGWPASDKAPAGKPANKSDLKRFYPTNVLTNDRGIINLWDARMIFSGLEFMGEIPFKDLIIHATILTKEGKRMSKSLGTGIDPLDLIERYGADATRFGLIWQSMGGQDIHWNEDHVIAGKKFLNKIWNASRFVLLRIGNSKLEILSSKQTRKLKLKTNKKILSDFEKTQKKVSNYIEKYMFGHALHEAYDFFWHIFCDEYIEKSKKYPDEETTRTLLAVLARSLIMLHPFIPFITEKLWAQLPLTQKKFPLIITDYEL